MTATGMLLFIVGLFVLMNATNFVGVIQGNKTIGRTPSKTKGSDSETTPPSDPPTNPKSGPHPL